MEKEKPPNKPKTKRQEQLANAAARRIQGLINYLMVFNDTVPCIRFDLLKGDTISDKDRTDYQGVLDEFDRAYAIFKEGLGGKPPAEEVAEGMEQGGERGGSQLDTGHAESRRAAPAVADQVSESNSTTKLVVCQEPHTWHVASALSFMRGVSPGRCRVLEKMCEHLPIIRPKIYTVAKKAGVSERSAKYAVRFWQQKGCLRKVGYSNGGRSRPTEYRLDSTRLYETICRSNPTVDREKVSKLLGLKGAIKGAERVQTDNEKGAILDQKGCNSEPERVQRLHPHRTDPNKQTLIKADPSETTSDDTVQNVDAREIATRGPSEQRNPPSPEVSASGPPPNSGPPPSRDELVECNCGAMIPVGTVCQECQRVENQEVGEAMPKSVRERCEELARDLGMTQADRYALVQECDGDLNRVLARLEELDYKRLADAVLGSPGDKLKRESEFAYEEWPEDDPQSRFLCGEDVQ